MSSFDTFQPETLTTGVAPCRSAEFQVTVMVCDSPGHRVMSLPVQIEVCSSLSPDSSVPPAVPRRTSARRKNATVGPVELFVIVTVVSRSAPAGPAWLTVVAVAATVAGASPCSPVKFAYDLTDACGLPIVLFQLSTSPVVGSQYTLRSTRLPFSRSSSSTKYIVPGAVGTVGVSTLLTTCCEARVNVVDVRSSSSAPAVL